MRRLALLAKASLVGAATSTSCSLVHPWDELSSQAPDARTGDAAVAEAGGKHFAFLNFDEDSDFAPFQRIGTSGGSTNLDDTMWRSPPRSLTVRLPEGLGHPHAGLRLAVPRAWAAVRLEFDIRVDPIAWRPGDINFEIASIYFYPNGAEGSVYDGTGVGLFMERDNIFANTLNMSPRVSPYVPTTLGEWTHVRVSIDPSVSGGRLAFELDGNIITESPVTAAASGPNPVIVIRVGLFKENPPTPAVVAHVDNVVLDLERY